MSCLSLKSYAKSVIELAYNSVKLYRSDFTWLTFMKCSTIASHIGQWLVNLLTKPIIRRSVHRDLSMCLNSFEFPPILIQILTAKAVF
jgi:hypothetical protein